MGAILAFILTMVLAFGIGLLLLCLMKNNGSSPTSVKGRSVNLRKRPGRMKKNPTTGQVKDIQPEDIPTILNRMSGDESIAIVMHSKQCGHCQKFLSQVIRPNQGKLPMNFYLVELNRDTHQRAQKIPVAAKLISEARGVPTTIRVHKSKNHSMTYSATAGAMSMQDLRAKLKAPTDKRLG